MLDGEVNANNSAWAGGIIQDSCCIQRLPRIVSKQRSKDACWRSTNSVDQFAVKRNVCPKEMQVVRGVCSNEFNFSVNREGGLIAATTLNSAHHQEIVGHFNGPAHIRHAIGKCGALNGSIKERECSAQFDRRGNRGAVCSD